MHHLTRTTGIIAISIGLSIGLAGCDTSNKDSDQGGEGQPLTSLQQKASYSYGVDVASRLKQQGIELDVDSLNRGIADAYNGTELALSDEERLSAKNSFRHN